MDEQSRVKMRQLAMRILPLLQVMMMGDAVQFQVVDNYCIDDVSVAIQMILPGVLAQPTVDMRELQWYRSVEEMAEAAAERFQELLDGNREAGPNGLVGPDPAYVLRHVQLHVVHPETNAEMLQASPHVEVLDLAGAFSVPVWLGHEMAGWYQLQWPEVQSMGLSAEQLYAAAQKNTLRHEPMRVIRTQQMDLQIMKTGHFRGKALKNARMDKADWYTVYNRSQHNSADYILIPAALAALREKMGADYYIAVPNVHEMLVYPDNGDLSGVLRFWDWFQQTPEWPALPDHFYRYSCTRGLQSLADA